METKPNPQRLRKLRTPVATVSDGGRGSLHLRCGEIALEVPTPARVDLLQLAAARGRVSASHHDDRGGSDISWVEALHTHGWSAPIPLIVVHRGRALHPLCSTLGSRTHMSEVAGAQAFVSAIAKLVKRNWNTIT